MSWSPPCYWFWQHCACLDIGDLFLLEGGTTGEVLLLNLEFSLSILVGSQLLLWHLSVLDLEDALSHTDVSDFCLHMLICPCFVSGSCSIVLDFIRCCLQEVFSVYSCTEVTFFWSTDHVRWEFANSWIVHFWQVLQAVGISLLRWWQYE